MAPDQRTRFTHTVVVVGPSETQTPYTPLGDSNRNSRNDAILTFGLACWRMQGFCEQTEQLELIEAQGSSQEFSYARIRC